MQANQKNMQRPVIIFGAKGMGKVALEIFKSNDVIVYGFLDDDPNNYGKEIDFVSVLGNTEDESFLRLLGEDCQAFIASDDNKLKKYLIKVLREDYKITPNNAVHSQAVVAYSALLGYGNLIDAGAVIGPEVKIGDHCIVRANANIDFESEIGNFVQIGNGSIVNSNVLIEDNVFVGSGVNIVSGLKISKNARIGAGSVVVEDVKEGTTVFGIPAKEIKV